MTLRNLPKPSGSWRTASVGIATGAAIITIQFMRLLDDNPATTFSEDQIITAAGMIWMGLVARDDKVTSQQAGATNP